MDGWGARPLRWLSVLVGVSVPLFFCCWWWMCPSRSFAHFQMPFFFNSKQSSSSTENNFDEGHHFLQNLRLTVFCSTCDTQFQGHTKQLFLQICGGGVSSHQNSTFTGSVFPAHKHAGLCLLVLHFFPKVLFSCVCSHARQSGDVLASLQPIWLSFSSHVT